MSILFRNLTLFRFPADTAAQLRTSLETDAAERVLREVGPLELSTSGFVPPLAADGPLVHNCDSRYRLIAIGTETRMLPNSVVQDELGKRIAEIQRTDGRLPGSKWRKRLREEVISELLPRAFVQPTRTRAYFDLDAGWLIVDTASRKRAEAVVSEIREALGRFPATPLAPDEPPSCVLTDWLALPEKLPVELRFGDECLLEGGIERGARWSGRGADLESDEVREHLRSGMRAWRLGLDFEQRLTFVLAEDLVVRKLRIQDAVLDALDAEPESCEAEYRLQFLLQTRELAPLLEFLAATFGIDRPGERE